MFRNGCHNTSFYLRECAGVVKKTTDWKAAANAEAQDLDEEDARRRVKIPRGRPAAETSVDHMLMPYNMSISVTMLRDLKGLAQQLSRPVQELLREGVRDVIDKYNKPKPKSGVRRTAAKKAQAGG